MNFRKIAYINYSFSFCFSVCVSMMIFMVTKGFSDEAVDSGIKKIQESPSSVEAVDSSVKKIQESPVMECCKPISYSKPMLELKVGYFFFSDSKMQKIYNHGGADVEISGSIPLWKWLQIYGSVEYLSRHGKSLNDHQKTSIWEIPLSLGLKPVICICSKVQYYFTLGPRYFFVHQHNNSSFVDKTITKNGLGGFVNTGFNFFPCCHLLIDVFGEYSFKKMSFHTSKLNVYGEKIQVGGFVFGIGLGYVF